MGIVGDVFGTATSGNAGDVLGQEGLGLTGTKNNQTTQVSLDPTTQALDSLRRQSFQDIQNTGNTAYNNLGMYYNTGESTNWLINQLINQSGQPGINSTDWYNQAIAGTDVSGQSARGYNAANTSAAMDYNALGTNLQGIQNLQPQLLGAGNDFFHQILGPQVQNQSSLMGLGRSGANEEAQAKGAASISLPIAQLIAQLTQQAYGQYGQGIQGIAGQYQQGEQGLGQQQLQNIYGINQAYPGISNLLQNAQFQRVLQGIGASDIPRSTAAQGQQDLVHSYLSTLNAMPYTAAPTQKTSGTGNTGVVTSYLGGGGGQGAGAAAGIGL